MFPKRNSRYFAIMAVSACAFLTPAFAGVQVSAAAAGSSPGTSTSGSGPITANTTATDGAASASAFGDLDLGILRVSANSAPIGLDTRAQTIVIDTFTFSSGASGVAFLDWSFDGSISAASNPSTSSRRSSGYFEITVSDRNNAYRDRIDLYEFGCSGGWNYGYGNCVDGASVNVARSIPFAITEWTFTVQVAAGATSSFGDVADFSNTGRLYLRLPSDVTISSGSGAFLSSAAPIPEPSSFAMLLSGGLLIAVIRTARGRLQALNRVAKL